MIIRDKVRTEGVCWSVESLLWKHWNLQKRNFIGLKWTQFLGSILQKLKSFSFRRKFNVAEIVLLRRAASFYLTEKNKTDQWRQRQLWCDYQLCCHLPSYSYFPQTESPFLSPILFVASKEQRKCPASDLHYSPLSVLLKALLPAPSPASICWLRKQIKLQVS